MRDKNKGKKRGVSHESAASIIRERKRRNKKKKKVGEKER